MTSTTMETFYPNLRDMLDDRFADLPDEQFEAAFESAFGEHVTPAEYEEFFGGLSKALSSVGASVGRVAKQAAPVLATAAQGALSGAASGSALGPYGMLGGALLGGVGSALQKHGGGRGGRQVGSALGSVLGTAGALTGRGGPGGALAGLSGLLGQRGGGPATNALRSILGRPQVSQALNALFAGRNPQIPVGSSGTPVPASAITGLLGLLAREAEEEAEVVRLDDRPDAFLVDAEGQLVVDPTVPEQRAGRVLQLFAQEFDDAAWWPPTEDIGEDLELDSEAWADFADEDALFGREVLP